MNINIERIPCCRPQLGKNEFLVATRVLRPDDRRVPLYDQFDAPLWVGRAYCTPQEADQLEIARARHIREAIDALSGSGIVFTSAIQKLMKRGLEPMLFWTEHDILNPGNSTVIVRTGVKPMELSDKMMPLMAYPMPHPRGLSQLVLYRPRVWAETSLPGYVRSERGTEVMEVTGFRIGRPGLVGRGVRSLTFPTFRMSHAERIGS